MYPNKTALERAFDLAQSGEVASISEIRRILNIEGYSADQLSGATLNTQLRKLIDEANQQ